MSSMDEHGSRGTVTSLVMAPSYASLGVRRPWK
jgi:hypothetical protein